MLSTPPARTIAWAPGRPFAPTALIDRFRIFSSQARPIIPTIAFLLLGELHSHARWIICLRAAAESKTFLQIARTAALQTGVHCQPGSPSRIPSRLGAFVSVTFLNLKKFAFVKRFLSSYIQKNSEATSASEEIFSNETLKLAWKSHPGHSTPPFFGDGLSQVLFLIRIPIKCKLLILQTLMSWKSNLFSYYFKQRKYLKYINNF